MINLNNMKIATLLVVMFAVLGQTTARGQKDQQSSNEAAIRQAGEAYIQALRRRDPPAAAACWTRNGTYTDAMGNTSKARELIMQKLKPAADEELTTDVDVKFESTIRFVTDKVAIEEGTHESQDVTGRYTATWVKSGERWLLDHLVEHASAAGPSAGRLEELSWMIGDWLGKNDEFTVMCNASWSENRKFIIRQFFIEQEGKQVLSGEQRIGWHPGTQSIRSWGFHSDGGIVEGRWRKEGDGWTVKTAGVAADGNQTSSISFWLKEGDDRCALKTIRINAGEEKVKDAVLEFHRLK